MTSRLFGNRPRALLSAAMFFIVAVAQSTASFGASAPVVDSGTGAVNARNLGRINASGLSANVPVRMFSWGAQSPAGARPTFFDVTITKAVDTNSPILLNHPVTALRFPTLQLEVFTPGTTTVLATYTFSSVLVTSVTAADPGRTNGTPLDQVTFTFSRIQSTVGTTTTCWDIAANAPC